MRRLRTFAAALLTWRFLEGYLPVTVVAYLAAATGVALASVAIGLVLSRVQMGSLAMLYLLVVLPTAIRFGRRPALFTCLTAVLTYDFFFTQPLHTFTMVNPEEWLVVALFSIVAVVASQLAVAQRERTAEALRREQEAAALHALSRGLNATDDLDAALQRVVEHLQAELALVGCAVLLPGQGGSGRATVRASAGIAPAGESAAVDWLAPSGDPVNEAPMGSRASRWVRIRPPYRGGGVDAGNRIEHIPLMAGVQHVGMLRLVTAAGQPGRTPEGDRLLSAAADQIARTVERARLRRAATETEILRKTDEVRQAILQAVSHDLRSPLAAIKGSAESLLQPDIPWTEEQRRTYLTAIRQEADRLHQLVENLLDLSRIEAGKLIPDRGWYPLDVLVDDVLVRLDTTVAGHPVVVDIPEELPPVPVDAAQIGQVLTNLVENAAKYTPPGTEIAIAARSEGAMVRVEVMDGGPGIPEEALPSVFEKFYRVSGGDRATTKGTGLGLAVARGFVEAHGGAITVESPPPGQPRGCRFSFTLPRGAAAQEQAIQEPAAQEPAAQEPASR